MPPGVWLREGAYSGAGQAAIPIFVGVGAQLVAGEPVDLELLDAVVLAEAGEKLWLVTRSLLLHYGFCITASAATDSRCELSP